MAGRVTVTYALKIAYDGRAYHGWQRLKDQSTVQGAIEAAVQAASGERVAVAGAGRTDRFAHAEGQVATFRLSEPQELAGLQAGLTEALPGDIELVGFALAADDFHARTSAVGKTYRYDIANVLELPDEYEGRMWHVPEPLNTEPMFGAVATLIGEHDFASFATKSKKSKRPTVCTMHDAQLLVDSGRISLRLTADSFLNHMVRNIVRALVKVGEGRFSTKRIKRILDAKERTASPGTAPAHGLYLEDVAYGPPFDGLFDSPSLDGQQ